MIAVEAKPGECFRACIAAILDLNPEWLPEFLAADGVSQTQAAKAWLSENGITLAEWWLKTDTVDDAIFAATAPNPGVPIILGGRTGDGIGHAVVVLDGLVACDPTRAGIAGPLSNGSFRCIVLAIGLAPSRLPPFYGDAFEIMKAAASEGGGS